MTEFDEWMDTERRAVRSDHSCPDELLDIIARLAEVVGQHQRGCGFWGYNPCSCKPDARVMRCVRGEG